MKDLKGKLQLGGRRDPGVRKLGAAVFQEEGLGRATGQAEMQSTVLGNAVCHGGSAVLSSPWFSEPVLPERSYPRTPLCLPQVVGFLRRRCLRSGPTAELFTVDLGAARHCFNHHLAQQWLQGTGDALAEHRKGKPKRTPHRYSLPH